MWRSKPGASKRCSPCATLWQSLAPDFLLPLPLQQAPPSPDFLQTWVGNHSISMAALNKPLLLEEFGVEVEPPASAAGELCWMLQLQ